MSKQTEATVDESLPEADELAFANRADPTQLQLAEQVRRTWWFQPAITLTIEDVMRPEFWSRCVHKFSVGGADQPPDRIEVMPSDRRWFLELMVLEIGAEGIIVMKVAECREVPRYRLPSKLWPLGLNVDDYQFENRGTLKWVVVRKHDGHVMTAEKRLSKEECAQWLDEYLKTARTT